MFIIFICCFRSTEVLLGEIGRKPNDDRQFDREGYSFAAGIPLSFHYLLFFLMFFRFFLEN